MWLKMSPNPSFDLYALFRSKIMHFLGWRNEQQDPLTPKMSPFRLPWTPMESKTEEEASLTESDVCRKTACPASVCLYVIKSPHPALPWGSHLAMRWSLDAQNYFKSSYFSHWIIQSCHLVESVGLERQSVTRSGAALATNQGKVSFGQRNHPLDASLTFWVHE